MRLFALPHSLLVALLVLCCAATARAQFVDASAAGEPVKLTAPWRFHAGDDPAWAAPGFDDSQWQLMPPDKDTQQPGRPADTRYGWYRIRVKLPATQEALALTIGPISCEVYAEGSLIGTVGKMRPRPEAEDLDNVNVLPLPRDLNGRNVVLAVRTVSLVGNSGILSQPPYEPSIAPARLQWQLREAASDKLLVEGAADSNAFLYQGAPESFYDALALFLGMFSLGLFLLRRRSTEYGCVALAYVLTAISDIASGYLQFHHAPVSYQDSLVDAFLAVILFATGMYVWQFIEARRGWLFWAAMALISLFGLVSQFEVHYVFGDNLGSRMLVRLVGTEACIVLLQATVILIFARMGISASQGNRNAQLLLIPFTLRWSLGLLAIFSWALSWAGVMKPWTFVAIQLGQVTVTWTSILECLSAVSMGLVLILRFARSAEREQRLSSELEAARTVQQILVPDEIPTIPGFAIQAVYHPAGQVGGDFYQVLPTSNGGLLAIIGDVSGKGMPAAMTVSLLVGTVRTLAHYTHDPAAILTAMNQRMIGRGSGFTTCLVLRLDPDGTLTAANAGHIAPYVNGKELSIDNGLPLGITAAAEYTNTTLHLEANISLTLLTDGVVEAQNAQGELFGFDRTAAISSKPAQNVAEAARTFGQQDDITVLTLGFAAAEVSRA